MSTSKDESIKQMALAIICAFGKAPAKHDDRNLNWRMLCGKKIPYRQRYDFDDKHRDSNRPSIEIRRKTTVS